MDKLPPIPIPAAQRWREIRLRILPIGVFLLTLLVAGRIWIYEVSSPGLVGQVELVRVDVPSPETGVIAELTTELFATVAVTQPLAEVDMSGPYTPAVTRHDILQARLQLLELEQGRPELDQQRTWLDLERLTVDLMQEKVDLETAMVRLRNANSELERARELHEKGIASASAFDLAEATQEGALAEVTTRSNLVTTLGVKLDKYREVITHGDNVEAKKIQIERKELQRSIDRLLEPVIIKAPVDGIVAEIHKKPGEGVVEGEPVLSISRTTSDKIIAYLDQSAGLLPQIGGRVKIQTRGPRRRTGTGRVIRVGSTFEVVPEAFAFATRQTTVFTGQPILISLPAALACRPGELVDLTLLPGSAEPTESERGLETVSTL